MKNKTLSNLIFASVGLAIITAVFETSLSIGIQDGLYSISGLGMGIFGIWAGIKLRNIE